MTVMDTVKTVATIVPEDIRIETAINFGISIGVGITMFSLLEWNTLRQNGYFTNH